LLKGFDLGEGGAGDGYTRHVMMFQVHKRGLDMVHVKRTAFAALFPAGSKHKMLYEQLAAALEQISQRLRTFRALKEVVLLDANPG
jgi:hypothetical protein